MDAIAVVGVPWNSHELGPAAADAEALGLRLCLVDTSARLAGVPAAVACERLAVPALELEPVCAALRDCKPRAIVSLTELKLELAARVREKLAYPGNPSAAERAVSDKLLTRRTLAAAGLTAVDHWNAPIGELRSIVEGIGTPVVVKPRALAGSNGVRLVRSPADIDDLLSSYDPAVAAEFGRDELIVEAFIPGTEVSLEGLAVGGRLTVFSMTDKINTGAPYFQEVGHIMPSRQPQEVQSAVAGYVQAVVTALGITTAPIHAEVKVHEGGVELVEIHTRYAGGNIVRLLTESLAMRPFRAYFEAVVDAVAPVVTPAAGYWGIGHFTARVGRPFSWRSYDFPRPHAVVELDLDARREPKLLAVEGIAIRYWRAGYALFASTKHDEIVDNVVHMTHQFPD